ncbi:MAG: hypothetical protein HBSAPP01_19400 [Candidatus Brocadia sapporoensis]|nr:MAG: hypothetical protein HBSAPP01_19400 [Candidatus Brocadia sapporoensis]
MIGIEIHTVNLIPAVLQKPFAEEIAYKAINTEDEHPLFRYHFNAATGAGTELETLNEIKITCHLGAAHIDAAISLTVIDTQNILAAGNHQWIGGEYGSRNNIAAAALFYR